ncbi:MAG: hypothetical protein CBD08_000590 [Cellvibrionales bacterium TMED148]|nr:hypothetical protein [Porticoccaceae bacterium]RPG93918.1 MAG: hypothetical protein CBD08_000590 [Cellvibrionales bacterium TMED148]
MFRTTHHGKESLTVNLKSAKAKELLLAKAASADVFIESFRPGVLITT